MVWLHTQIWVKDHSGREETEHPDASPFMSCKQSLPSRGHSTEREEESNFMVKTPDKHPRDQHHSDDSHWWDVPWTRVWWEGHLPSVVLSKTQPNREKNTRRISTEGHPTEHLTPNRQGHENQESLRNCFSPKETKETWWQNVMWDRGTEKVKTGNRKSEQTTQTVVSSNSCCCC